MINIETKARCKDINKLRQKVSYSGGEFEKIMEQTDTYFNVPDGKRLKLRVFNNEPSKFVLYIRENLSNSKDSNWEAVEIPDHEKFKKLMSAAYGILVEVKKVRELWMINHTRVHLDQVKELGSFMELETVLDGITRNEGVKEHNKIIKALGIKLGDFIQDSYSDLLLQKINEGKS